MSLTRTHGLFVILVSLLIFPILLVDSVQAALVPDWVKNIAKWYGNDEISEEDARVPL